MTVSALTDATIFTGEAFVEGHALLVKDGKVADIVRKIPGDAKVVSHAGKILAPGFIDAQVNGGGNVFLNNTPTAEACLAIAAAHRAYGTSHILPTVITDTPEVTAKAVAAVREARRKDKSILGIHIEGPHLSEARRGVHKAEYLRKLSDEDLKLYRPEAGDPPTRISSNDDSSGEELRGTGVMLVTLAPECASPEQIKQLRAQGVIVSIGHTQATPEQTRAALAAGATGFTHLFNGMGGLSARGNGPADVALDDRNSWCGIIADGHHVIAEMIRLAVRVKPEKIFLVSDAMPPSASHDPKPFQLYGETIRAEGGRCVNGEGKLAGAVLTIGEAVHNCVKKFGIEPDDVLRMASTYPAAFLGLDKSLGKLVPGYEASVAVLTTEFKFLHVVPENLRKDIT